MSEKIVQTAGREQLGEFAPMFAHLNDDVLFGEVWNEALLRRAAFGCKNIALWRGALNVSVYTVCAGQTGCADGTPRNTQQG